MGSRDWSPAVCSSNLLVRGAGTLQTTAAGRAAEGLQRKLDSQRDALTAFDVLAAVADLAETQRFDPGQRLETETVVELRGIDVGRLVVGLLPQIEAGRVAGNPPIGRASCRERVCQYV